MTLRAALGLLLLASAASCATEVDSQDAQLELGTGSWRFEPLDDGAPVELVAGAQGGHHIWISVRVAGMGADRIPLRIQTQPADENRPPQVTELDEIRLDPPKPDGMRAYLGWPHILSEPGCLVGQMLRIEVSTTAPDGTQLHTERDVIVHGGDDPPSCAD